MHARRWPGQEKHLRASLRYGLGAALKREATQSRCYASSSGEGVRACVCMCVYLERLQRRKQREGTRQLQGRYPFCV